MSYERARLRMVEEQVRARGLTDERLLSAFRKVPRHLFVPTEVRHQAYEDTPLPIGAGQTISQPYIVALMVSRLRLQGHERVLDVGAGSGYQTAILAELALDVYAVEWLPELLTSLAERLEALGYLNVRVTSGDGSLGWPDYAPYDAIIVSAGAPAVPPPLSKQLGDPGRMVIPVGSQQAQVLTEVEKQGGSVTQRGTEPCVFVPLVGTYGWPER